MQAYYVSPSSSALQRLHGTCKLAMSKHIVAKLMASHSLNDNCKCNLPIPLLVHMDGLSEEWV
jgi:hypothetical protein